MCALPTRKVDIGKCEKQIALLLGDLQDITGFGNVCRLDNCAPSGLPSLAFDQAVAVLPEQDQPQQLVLKDGHAVTGYPVLRRGR
jgi:hypothetical protein